MRTKFQAKIVPSYKEQSFIDRLECTHDTYHISEASLCIILGVNERDLRYYKERYNNGLYEDIVPKGKIVCIKGKYRLITPDSVLKDRYVNKAKFDLICSAIDYHNTLKSLGQLEVSGQLSLYNLHNMTYDELINLGKETQDNLKSKK